MSETARGFEDLPCPKCMDDGTVTVYLSDMDTFNCTACEEEFTRGEIEAVVKQWGAVLAWIDTAPAYQSGGSNVIDLKTGTGS